MGGEQPNKLRVVGVRERRGLIAEPETAEAAVPATVVIPTKPKAQSAVLSVVFFLVGAATAGGALAYLSASGVLP